MKSCLLELKYRQIYFACGFLPTFSILLPKLLGVLDLLAVWAAFVLAESVLFCEVLRPEMKKTENCGYQVCGSISTC